MQKAWSLRKHDKEKYVANKKTFPDAHLLEWIRREITSQNRQFHSERNLIAFILPPRPSFYIIIFRFSYFAA